MYFFEILSTTGGNELSGDDDDVLVDCSEAEEGGADAADVIQTRRDETNSNRGDRESMPEINASEEASTTGHAEWVRSDPSCYCNCNCTDTDDAARRDAAVLSSSDLFGVFFRVGKQNFRVGKQRFRV